MLRRLIPVAFALIAAFSLLGCEGGDNSTSPARYGMTVDLQGMAQHLGQMMEFRVVHTATGVEVAYWRVPQVVSPNFAVTMPDCLILGESYTVDFYADMNMNGHYDTPPTDHAWRRWSGPTTGPMVLMFTHDAFWVDIDFPEHH